MDSERRAQIVRQPPSRKEKGAHARRLAIGQRTVEGFVERLLEGAARLPRDPVGAELLGAAAEAFEGPLVEDLQRAGDLFGRAQAVDLHGKSANLGSRRLSRQLEDPQRTIEDLERALNTAEGPATRTLRYELARTLLYQADHPRKALLLLEDLEAEREAEEWMGFDVFLLWEDALWATGQWRRYEELLRKALTNRGDDEDLARLLEQRLLYLYRYILPDARQTEIIVGHRLQHGDLDPELLDFELRRLDKLDQGDEVMELLNTALSRPECASREMVCRMLLADIARYKKGDLDHAAQVLRAGLESDHVDPLVIYELLDIQQQRGDVPGLVDALGFSLEVLASPADRADVLFRIGALLFDEMAHKEAGEEVFVEALRELPTHTPSLRRLGQIYRERSDWAALVGLYERELELSKDPQRWRKHFRLARIYSDQLDELEQAFTHYKHALSFQPANLSALKGAGKVIAKLQRWIELVPLYVAAETATEDSKQRRFLLERIAQIAEDHLGDTATALKALEALRVLDPEHAGAIASLGRLYAAHEMYAELIALNDEELGWTEDAEAAAELLCHNGELCDTKLDDAEQAEIYYRKALDKQPSFILALEGLKQIYHRESRWEDLVDLGLGEAEEWGTSIEAVRHLQGVAELLERHLDRPEEAVELYQRCLEIDPTDRISRQALIRQHQAAGDWHEVCHVLEMEAEHGGRGGHAAASLLRMGKIKADQLDDEEGAVDAYRRAFLSSPSSPILLRTWLNLARKLDALEEPRRTLASVSGEVSGAVSRVDLLVALTEFCMEQTHDPLTAAGYLEVIESLEPERPTSTTLYNMALARSGRWTDRARVALGEHRPTIERRHGLEASLVLGVPELLAARTEAELKQLDDTPEALASCWSLCPPARRPPHHALPASVRSLHTDEAQGLRRWSTLMALRAGMCTEPASVLLPPNEQDDLELSLRPDLELLATFYEQTRQPDMFLQVLAVQEEKAESNAERARLCIERCKVFDRLDRHEESRKALHQAFKVSGFDDPARDLLYDRLESGEDWDFLIQELRRHLRQTEDPARQSELWLRLSHALEQGPKDLEEALRALDAAYRSYPSDGSLLADIARLAEGLGELAIARRALDDYLVYHQPAVEVQLELAMRIVRLNADGRQNSEPQRVIAWLEDLVVRSCDDLRALKALAEAHARAGSPFVACDTLLRIVRLPYRADEMEQWLLLAALYAGPLEESERAEALYWELMNYFPEDEALWTAINEFYPRTDKASRLRLVGQLEALLGRAEEVDLSVEQQRRFYGEMGRILGEELGRWHDSQDVLMRAIDSSIVPAPELAKQRAYAMCRVPGKRRDAYRSFCELLVEDPFQPEILRKAIGLCEDVEAYDRARILKQFAEFFVPESNLHAEDRPIRPKTRVTRSLDVKILTTKLLHPGLRGSVYEVLHEALPLIENVFRDELPELSAVGGKRLKSRNEMSTLYSDAAGVLGLGSVRIFLGNNESPMPMVFDSPNAFWIPKDQWDGMDTACRRHWAGYAAGVLWTGLSKLAYLSGREIWQVLDGIFYSQTGSSLSPGGKSAYTIEAAEKVKSPWHRRARKEIASLLREAGERVNGEQSHQWIDWLQSTGDRCGLVFGGHIGTSTRAMLAGEGWRGELNEKQLRRHLKTNGRLGELLDFALSEDYLRLRYEAGLAPRPSTLKD